MAEETQEIKEVLISELDPRFVRQIENAEKSLSVDEAEMSAPSFSDMSL